MRPARPGASVGGGAGCVHARADSARPPAVVHAEPDHQPAYLGRRSGDIQQAQPGHLPGQSACPAGWARPAQPLRHRARLLMLATLVALLAAATVAVPLTRRFGLGSVLGYLLAGVAIGPSGLGLVSDVGQIADIASLGVVMLLFLIGLELRPKRLWGRRGAVFALGSAQVILSAAVLAVLTHWAGVPWAGGVVLGAGLAMSSTAIVLPMFAEADLLKSR